MSESTHMSIHLPAKPEAVYNAWLDGAGHSNFTGSPATVDARPGGAFTAWDGYIFGHTLEMESPRRILQAWRTTEFLEIHPDSLLEVLIEPEKDGCKLTLHHTNIPDGQAASYEQGWRDFYFDPMLAYFTDNK